MPNHELEIKIWEIKNKIADLREYISSDFCTSCIEMYKKRETLEQTLKELENERDRQS
jgi:hypothetical protein